MREPYSKAKEQKVIAATLVGMALIIVIWVRILLPLQQRQLLKNKPQGTPSAESVFMQNIKETFNSKNNNTAAQLPAEITN